MPLNVLLADDSVPAQNMGKKILVDAGYDVLTVSNGLEALRKIADVAPDIAILDIFMPGYTGLEICERLRANAATANIPVILTVGKLEPYRPEDGEHVHSNAVIVKPFSSEELISAVRSLIGESTPAQEVPPPPPPSIEETESNVPQEIALQDNAPQNDVSPQKEESAPAQDAEDEPEEEPLFYYGSLEDPSEISGLQTPSETNVKDDRSNDSEGPASLVFNPDAVSTPFSASVIELVPSVPEISEEQGPSAFAEFNQETAGAPAVEKSALEVSEPAQPSAVAEIEIPAQADAVREAEAPEEAQVAEVLYGTTEPEVGLEDSNATAVEPEFADTAASVASISTDASDFTSEDTPAHDPLLDLQEAAAPIAVLMPDVDSHAPVEELALQEAAAPVDSVSSEEDEYEAPISPEEEARREAFERLFNSPDPLPLENYSPEPLTVASSVLPSIAESFEHHSAGIAPDSEIESLISSEPQFVALEPDPYLMEEEAPIDAIGTIPDRDNLLDGSLSENEEPIVASTLAQEEVMTSAPSEVPAPPEVTNEQAFEPVPEIAASIIPDTEEVMPDAGEYLAPEVAQIAPVEYREPAEAMEPEQSPEAEQPIEPEQAIAPEQIAVPEQVVALEQAANLEQSVVMEEVKESGEPAASAAPEILPEEVQALTDALVLEEHETVPEYAQPDPALEPVFESAPEPDLSVASQALEPLEAEPEVISIAPSEAPEPVQSEPEEIAVVEPLEKPSDADRIQQAIERVFDCIKPLLIEAIVREMARPTE